MKKYFYIGIVIVVALSMILVTYGGYLNYNDENQIANRMEERALQLSGVRVEKRNLRTSVHKRLSKVWI